jgi:hypothetical protein
MPVSVERRETVSLVVVIASPETVNFRTFVRNYRAKGGAWQASAISRCWIFRYKPAGVPNKCA